MSRQAALPGMSGLIKTAAKISKPRGSKSITCKLSGDRYIALRLAAIDTGLSHQDIMVAAFDAWLRNHEIAKAIESASTQVRK